MTQGKRQEVEEVRQVLYNNSRNCQNPQDLEKSVLIDSGRSTPIKVSFLDNIKCLFQDKRISRGVLTGISFHIMKQMCGVNAISFYSTKILKNAGFDQTFSSYVLGV